MQLARAAGKTANKFLYSRGLQKADRDDVISAALLWCWENRDNYSLTTTLETWFMNAVRDAYKNLTRDALPGSAESIANLSDGDDTYNTAAAESSAKALIDALPPDSKRVAMLIMRGYTRSEMLAGGVPERAVNEARQRIKQLRKLLPEHEVHTSMRTSRLPSLDDLDEDSQVEPSSIDVKIAQLDFMPHAGKDCPPCWRCMWFEGFMPSGKLETRLKIEDQEVRDAVKNTEARKIEIAQQVRNGT